MEMRIENRVPDHNYHVGVLLHLFEHTADSPLDDDCTAQGALWYQVQTSGVNRRLAIDFWMLGGVDVVLFCTNS
jgi:hypothetical protein